MAKYGHCFIAEKPSLAAAIAEGLAAKHGVSAVKQQGYISVGADVVTYFFGHMYELCSPKAYGDRWASWNLESLPIVLNDNEWRHEYAKGRDGTTDGTKKQAEVVRNLAKQADCVTAAGDAGAEGQLLVDEALKLWGIDPFGPKVKRLWVKSYALKDMLAALNNLLPNSQKRGLSDAATTRQRMDWSFGMTYSRLMTIKGRQSGMGASVNIGRVMTPTLAIVVARDLERENFKPTDYFIPQVNFHHANGTFTASWVMPDGTPGVNENGQLEDRAVAERIAAKVDGKPGAISGYKTTDKSQPPPKPFSLSALQKECSKKFGMSAQETLDVAQKLYEAKLLTYPRTDCQELPESLIADIRDTMKGLHGFDELREAVRTADPKRRTACWKSEIESDHHAIIPTSAFTPAALNGMSATERSVFLAVARLFLAQFHGDYRYKSLVAEVLCEREIFRATGKQVVDVGWRRVYEDGDEAERKEEGEGEPTLPQMAQGDKVKAEGTTIAAKRTSPPPAFDDGLLIDAMANCHRFEADPERKKRLKDGQGIGTEATRAATIEKLVRLAMIERRSAKKGGKAAAKATESKKQKLEIVSTDFGRAVIAALRTTAPDLCSVGLTAEWGENLERIEKNRLAANDFMADQNQALGRRVAELRGAAVSVGVSQVKNAMPGHGEKCTACGIGVMVTREGKNKEGKPYKGLFCSNRDGGCRNVLWGDSNEPKKRLAGDGKPCPECGKGVLKTFEGVSKSTGKPYKMLSCSAWREGCKHKEFVDDDKSKGGSTCSKPSGGKPATGKGKGQTTRRKAA